MYTVVDVFRQFEDDSFVVHFSDGKRMKFGFLELRHALGLMGAKSITTEGVRNIAVRYREKEELEHRIRIFGLDWLRRYHHELGNAQAERIHRR